MEIDHGRGQAPCTGLTQYQRIAGGSATPWGRQQALSYMPGPNAAHQRISESTQVPPEPGSAMSSFASGFAHLKSNIFSKPCFSITVAVRRSSLTRRLKSIILFNPARIIQIPSNGNDAAVTERVFRCSYDGCYPLKRQENGSVSCCIIS